MIGLQHTGLNLLKQGKQQARRLQNLQRSPYPNIAKALQRKQKLATGIADTSSRLSRTGAGLLAINEQLKKTPIGTKKLKQVGRGIGTQLRKQGFNTAANQRMLNVNRS